MFAPHPRPRKTSKHAAEHFRGLGKHQNTPLNVSDASESSKTRRGTFPRPRKAQNTSLKVSEASGAAAAAGEVWLGTKLSSLPRKGPSRMPTKLAGYQAKFPAPEGAAAAAGEVWPGTKLSSLLWKGPSRMPAKSGRVPRKLRWRPQPPRSRSVAAPQIGLSVYFCRHHLRTHQ